MAHFRGTIQGSRREASRLGSKDSGLTANLNGWNFGVTILLYHGDGKDHAYVIQTGGSNHRDVPPNKLKAAHFHEP